MKMTATPRSLACTTYFSTTPDCLTPRLLVGSSRISTLSPKWTARAMATACRSPPERVPTGWSTSRVSITRGVPSPEGTGRPAIARAVHFGAKVLILDEPTSNLGVKQSGVVLKYVVQAKERGVAVIFITHNPHHSYLVGDHFFLLNRGRLVESWDRDEVDLDELVRAMAGGAELEALAHELESLGGSTERAAREEFGDRQESGS